MDAEAHAEEVVISMMRSRTYTVRGLPPVRSEQAHGAIENGGAARSGDCRGEAVLAPGLAHGAQPLADLALPGYAHAPSHLCLPDDEGLALTFAGDRLEISAEAMACNTASVTISGAAPIEAAGIAAALPAAPASDLDEFDTDSSPASGQVVPDIGERVL
ncbi:MAG: hypothetical protein JW889_13375 [Verrucomicrobia bacterium]|nr:hypothetical protein [Verrucomicrobiota bacterium]